MHDALPRPLQWWLMLLVRVHVLGRLTQLSSAAAAALPPTVLWTSSSAAANRTLLLHGQFEPAACLVHQLRCEPTESGREALTVDSTANSSTPTTLAFTLPASARLSSIGCRSCTVSCSTDIAHASSAFTPNAPEIWWLQGSGRSGRYNASSGTPEAGISGAESAAPGQLVRLFGRNLGGGQVVTSARLVSSLGDKSSVSLTYVSAQSSANTATFRIPEGTPVSTTVGWRVVLTTHPCDLSIVAPEMLLVDTLDGFDYSAVFKVAELGLHGALQAAASATRGGIVEFGKGRFQMNGSIDLPAQTLLRGAGIDETFLWWDDNTTATQGDHLIGARGSYPCCSYGVEDLSISSKATIATVFANARYMDIRVRRVRVRQDAFFRLGDACPGASMRGRTVNFTASDVGGVFMIESANRVEITDCDVWATSNFAFIYDSRNVVISRNRIRYGNFGLRLGHTVRAFVADNDIAGISWVAGGSIFLSTYEYAGGGQTGTQNFIVLRNNSIHDVYGRDREAITTDGGSTAYLGVLSAVTGRNLTLAADPVFVMDPTQGMSLVHSDWTGTAVYIMRGPGAGQWRRVTSNEGRRWQVETPFTVPPDPYLSVINIASLRSYHIWEENTITDAGVIQVFASLVNSVIARNTIVRSAGFSILGTAFPWTDGPVNATTGVFGQGQKCQPAQPATADNCQWWQVGPAWFIELLNNHIAEGIGYADSSSNELAVTGNQDYGGWPLPNVSGPLQRSYVPFGTLSYSLIVRDNVIASEGQMSVQADRNDGTSLVAAVVEGNAVVGRTQYDPADGPTFQIGGNRSGWVVRENLCDGKPCAARAN